MKIINQIKCLFFGHDKIYYYDNEKKLIIECISCGSKNVWKFN